MDDIDGYVEPRVEDNFSEQRNQGSSPQIGGNYSDPLFLSNSDHPGMQLVSNQFSGANYHSWSRSVKMALGAKMKLCFINGMCKKPTENPQDTERWIRCDFMAMSWLINSMKPEIAENFMYVLSAAEL